MNERLEALETLMVAYLLVWGFWIASPWWTIYDSTPTFRMLSTIAPAWVVGGLPILSALLLSIAYRLRLWRLRWAVLFFLVGFFQFVAVLYFLSNPVSPAWITNTLVAIILGLLLFSPEWANTKDG